MAHPKHSVRISSSVFEQFVSATGIRHVKTAPYYLSSNGLAELTVQTFKAGIVKQRPAAVQIKIDRFLIAYRNVLLESTAAVRRLRTRLKLIFQDAHYRME